MSTFLFAYRAPKGYSGATPEEAAAWRQWFGGMEDGVVADVGNPIFHRDAVGRPAGETELGGYSLICAEDIEDALEIAHGCPLIAAGGAVEVGEVTPLNPESMVTTVTDHDRASRLVG